MFETVRNILKFDNAPAETDRTPPLSADPDSLKMELQNRIL